MTALDFLMPYLPSGLRIDGRIPENAITLNHLLSRSGLSKTEFARRLRDARGDDSIADTAQPAAPSQRRGKSKSASAVLWGRMYFVVSGLVIREQ